MLCVQTDKWVSHILTKVCPGKQNSNDTQHLFKVETLLRIVLRKTEKKNLSKFLCEEYKL
jgi:hypothetical protein